MKKRFKMFEAVNFVFSLLFLAIGIILIILAESMIELCGILFVMMGCWCD